MTNWNFKMIKFIDFLFKIILINAILFALIGFISIKLKLIFLPSDKQKKQDGEIKPELSYVATMPTGKISESDVFEIDKPTFRQLFQSQKRMEPDLLCQELSFVTSIDDFPGRFKFNLFVKALSGEHGLEIQHTKDIKLLIDDIWEQTKNAS